MFIFHAEYLHASASQMMCSSYLSNSGLSKPAGQINIVTGAVLQSVVRDAAFYILINICF